MKKTFLLIITLLIIYANQNVYTKNIILADSLNISFNKKLDLGTDVSLSDIDCYDEKNCLLTVNYSNVGSCLIKTNDGGETWEHVLADEFSKSYGEDKTKANKDYVLVQSSFIDQNTIFSADAFSRMFFKTANSGETWDTIPGSIKDTLIFIDKFKMIDVNYGYFTTYRYLGNNEYDLALYYTQNGCKSWNRLNIEMNFYDSERYRPYFIEAIIKNNQIYSLYRMLDKKNVLRYESVIVKYDINTHEQYKIDLPSYINDFYFISENEGIAVGNLLKPLQFEIDSASIYKTYDGGKTWDIVFKGDRYFKEAYLIHYYSNNLIAVTGRGNRLYISSDKGENWYNISDTNDIAATIYPLCIASENVIYFISHDKLYKWVDGKTSVVELPKIIEFKIYPNPVQDYLQINPPQSPFGKAGLVHSVRYLINSKL
jgi:photosystem II stability/assembly factor-like uncharacterized protein